MVNTILRPWFPNHLNSILITTTMELTKDQEKAAAEAFCMYPPYGPFPEKKQYVTEAVEKLKKTDPELAAKIVIPD